MNRLVELVLIAWAAVAVAHTTITPPQHHEQRTPDHPAAGAGAAFDVVDDLYATRRPKPSLKEQALAAQQRMWDGGVTHADWELIRRALEQLDD